jgi:hypothetical protein
VAWQDATASAAQVEPTTIDVDRLRRSLPRGRARTIFTPVEHRVRRVTVVDRDSAANVVCLGMATPRAPGSWRREGGAGPQDAAAFVSREAGGLTLAWTSIASRTPGSPVRLAGPLARDSFGSPLVSSAGLSGIVLSERRVAPVSDIERAASRSISLSRE